MSPEWDTHNPAPREAEKGRGGEACRAGGHRQSQPGHIHVCLLVPLRSEKGRWRHPLLETGEGGMVSQCRKAASGRGVRTEDAAPRTWRFEPGAHVLDLTQASQAGAVLAILRVRVASSEVGSDAQERASGGPRSADPGPELGLTVPDSVPLQGPLEEPQVYNTS